jgi:signal transduction histidine kinase
MARVLVVDDDPLAARQVAQVVGEDIRHVVDIATSAAAARAFAAAPDARPDAAVIGFRLGGAADGTALAAELRAADPHLAVILTTAAGDGEGAERARAAAGPLAHLSRPAVAGELLPRLSAALERATLARQVDRLEHELEHRERALSSTSNELATATERLVVAEQLAAVGRVVGGIAHELEQQLALVGYAEALKSRLAVDPALVELADVIVNAQKRLLAMVDAIRDFSGGVSDRPLAVEPADLAAVVEEALAIIGYDRDVRRRRIVRRLAAHPLCRLHHDKMTQVVINLVHNAALATEDGGEIEVAVEEPAGGAALLTVTDRGAGMPPDVLARLGEPFFTTRGDRGSGLGVGICRRIVEEHGGTLTFSSVVGAGTTARVRLPTIGDDLRERR